MESTEEKYLLLFVGGETPKIGCAFKPLPVSVIEMLSIAFTCAWGVCASTAKLQR